MENENNTNKNHTIEPNEGEVHGRTYNSHNPTVDKQSASADISAVDQQEGNMEPGETGAAAFTKEQKKAPEESAT